MEPGEFLKTCRKCGATKAASEFYAGQGNTCKECAKQTAREWQRANPLRHKATREKWEKRDGAAIDRRKHRLRRRYQISIQRVDEMIKEQGGVCIICRVPLISPLVPAGQEPPRSTRGVVDHDHRDGHVRGILCSACNTGLGQFEDNMEFIKAAYHYLKRDNAKMTTSATDSVSKMSGNSINPR